MRPTSPSPRVARLLVASFALVVASCTDRGGPLSPRPPEPPARGDVLTAVDCTADVAARTVACSAPRRSGTLARAAQIVYGGQHVYVSVISGTPSVTADTFAFTMAVQNLIPQAIGTTDGSTADSAGVKLFFHAGPVAVSGAGAVTVANPDGVAAFTAANQPFFRYVGVLPTGAVSGARTWKLRFTPGVVQFSFQLFVSSPVRYPQGWIDVAPAAATFMTGTDDTLKATVRSAVGDVLPNQPVAWLSSSPDSAPVTPLPGDSLVVVHGAGSVVATITATSGPRTGTASANVLPRAPSEVSVSGRQLVVRRRNRDGSLGPPAPYVIRGVSWSPATPQTNTFKSDLNNAAVRRAEFGPAAAADIPLMAAMHVNTVRLVIDPGVDPALGPVGMRVLDQLHARGIMVVMTVDDAINDTARVRAAVQYYRNHPAVLMWMLGNEWNISILEGHSYGGATTMEAAAQRTEAAAALIKSIDAGHPVSTSYGDIDIPANGVRLADTQRYVNTVCPHVDVWGLNIYRARTFESLFQQWASISTKPMFLSEFGTDAFRTASPVNPPVGAVDEAMQKDWDLNLWSDLYRNLSALDPAKVALGGMVFEWNDEWWKVSPYSTQETGGRGSGHPDAFANEEYFGIVSIDRTPRQLYDGLRTAFAPGFVPGAPTVKLQAVSAGDNAGSYADLGKDGVVFYHRDGRDHGGRGFNVAVIDSSTGAVLHTENFDTWITRMTGTAMNAMVSYLNALPNGSLVEIAVGDEAGINEFDVCTILPYAFVEQGLSTLEGLGATRIRSYCYRNSWAMVVVKGNPASAVEQLGTTAPVSVALTVTLH